MGKANRDKTPRVRPVEKIELSEGRTKLRTVLFCAFLVIALLAFTYAVISYLHTDPGWQTVTASASDYGQSCAGDFVFQYYISDIAENKLITSVYTELCGKAYKLFSTEAFAGINNLGYINANINTEIKVDGSLYKALSLIVASGDRSIFGSPVYDYYLSVFGCDYDEEAKEFDPRYSEEARDFISQALTYINDPGMISLELLGDDTVVLRVSDAYRAFARQNGITAYTDLTWMKNAFIIDYLADTLNEKGYTLGNLTSYDGFTRNLDKSGQVYAFNLFNKVGATVYPAGIMYYSRPISIVNYRSYAMNTLDALRFYVYGDGTTATPYMSLDDGLDKCASTELICFSYSKGCAETLLSSVGEYISDSVDTDILKQRDIGYVRFDDNTAYYYGEGITIGSLLDDDNVTYTSSHE